ncbi:hypothetical protein LTR17_007775 [Elasticomyces elasticus]|nr:hypothetical protein LTR17_007775 [Elasticomyces elasticus]
MAPSGNSAGKRKAEESPDRRQRITYTNTIPPSSQQSGGSSQSKRSSAVPNVSESVKRGAAATTVKKPRNSVKAIPGKHVPSPLEPGHVVWVPWHDGCLYSAAVTKVLPDQFFEFQYTSTNVVIRLALKDVRPNHHDERFGTDGVNSYNDAIRWQFGKLALAYSASMNAYLPARVIRFHEAGNHLGKRQPTRVEVKFLNVLETRETVHCQKLRALEPNSPTKLDADGTPFYPLSYQIHHPGHANLQLMPDSDFTTISDRDEYLVGDFVIAKWPASNQYHLGVVVPDHICPGERNVPVLFFQDPKRKNIRGNIVARIDEKHIMSAPQDLPSPPKYCQKGSYGLSEHQWLEKQRWEDAQLENGQWVAVRVSRSRKAESQGFHVLGKIRMHDATGFHVDVFGEDSPSVTVQRGLLRPIYKGEALLYKKGHEPVWPELAIASAPQAAIAPHGKLWQPSKSDRAPQGQTKTIKTTRGYRVNSGWKSILELVMFDKVSSKDPAVDACLADGVRGRIDASSREHLFVWAAKPSTFAHLYPDIKIRISSDVTVSWHLDTYKGDEGIQIKVGDEEGTSTFKIRITDRTAACRAMKNVKMKMQRVRQLSREQPSGSVETILVED